jgi:hypothetical protein
MALGMGLVYTAVAGFSVLSQAITASRRLSIENGLMRVGMQLALEEVDFWTTSDDPLDANKQPLRTNKTLRVGGSNGVAGMPFTPFLQVNDVITGGNFIDNRPGLDEVAGNPRGGWNPNPLARAAWDQRTWTCANVAEAANVGSNGGYQYWGTFGIYENLDPLASWHHWHGGQVLGLMDGLGFWGVYDYLPSNASLVYHTAKPAQVPKDSQTPGLSWGEVPLSLLVNDRWLRAPDGGDTIMRGRIRSSNGSRYYMPGPEKATPVLSRGLAQMGYEGRDSGGGNSAWDGTKISTFLANTRTGQQALPQRPAHWPDVSFEVRRFMERGHNLTSCTIASSHPLTGTRIAFSFAVVGTTLRGARQQRLPDMGWADPFTGPTLDYDYPNPLPKDLR